MRHGIPVCGCFRVQEVFPLSAVVYAKGVENVGVQVTVRLSRNRTDPKCPSPLTHGQAHAE